MSSIAEENVPGDPVGVFLSQEELGSGKMISGARRKSKEKSDGGALHIVGLSAVTFSMIRHSLVSTGGSLLPLV